MKKRSRPAGLRTWIEIDRKALKNNYSVLRKHIPSATKLLAVVKSNAYGHGLVGFSKEVVDLGADWLGVDSLVEGIRLRKEGFKVPILVLGYTLPENYSDAAEHNISLVVSSLDQLKGIVRSKLPLSIHLKIDTGMHRQGLFVEELDEAIKLLKKASFLSIEGVCTHLAGKDPYTLKENRQQLALFDTAVEKLQAAGFNPLRHADNTWGIFSFPEAHFDMVRTGAGLYGLWPSPAVETRFKKKFPLAPILTWKTVVSEIKTLKEKGGVGYSFSEVAPRGARIAICPVGYWHGYPRALSSKGEVLIHGHRAKLVGRVSMDMIAVDITGIKGVVPLDEVILLGGEGKKRIFAEEFERKNPGSLTYEVVTRINPLIKKLYL